MRISALAIASILMATPTTAGITDEPPSTPTTFKNINEEVFSFELETPLLSEVVVAESIAGKRERLKTERIERELQKKEQERIAQIQADIAAQNKAEELRVKAESKKLAQDSIQRRKLSEIAQSTPEPQTPQGSSCAVWLEQAGVTDKVSAEILIMKESGCNPNAVNPSSGACGIGQQLPCGKWKHRWNDPVGSIIDMQDYVFARYGSWSAALSHSNSVGWY